MLVLIGLGIAIYIILPDNTETDTLRISELGFLGLIMGYGIQLIRGKT